MVCLVWSRKPFALPKLPRWVDEHKEALRKECNPQKPRNAPNDLRIPDSIARFRQGRFRWHDVHGDFEALTTGTKGDSPERADV